MHMHQEIRKKIDELHDAIREHASTDAITFRLFISSEEINVDMAYRTPDQLKDAGISMRNLAGRFIR
jgi:hypothetical protein